jgi:MoaA/NifB/PqqE/SkfB family radical SAM enzyme
MSDELFNLVLENAKKYAQSVQIGFFGEPLLHPKFENYIKSFPINRSYTLELNTNWSLVTKKNLDTLRHFDCVIISLDASYPALWEKLCPGAPVLDLNGVPCQDRYNTITDKIEYWLSLPGHAPTRITYVVSSINEHDKKNFVKKWRSKLGPHDHILTKSVLSYGGVMKDSHMKKNSCEVVSQYWFTIAWNGDCSPCNLDVNIELNGGNLLEVRDMKKITEGDKWKQITSKIRQKSGICSNCFDANNWTENKVYYGEKNIKLNLANSIRKAWLR